MNDLLALKTMDKEALSPYEQVKIGYMQQKQHTGGVAVTGLVTGIVGTVAGVTAWIFGSAYANAKANQAKEAAQSAKEIASVQIAASQRQIDQLTNLFAAERQERISGDLNITTTISDTLSGTQQGTLTAQQQAIQTAEQTVLTGLMTGQYSENPQKVTLYAAPQPCGCPGCGCNG